MKRPHNLAPQAIRDVESAADWFADSPGGEALARRFARAVAEAADRIARHYMGRDPGPLLAELREKPYTPET